MRIKLFYIVIAVLLIHSTHAQIQHLTYPYIQNYTTKDYNGQPDNFAAIEDERGFMFFGNLWGILEFNGNDWRNIYFPNGSSGVSFGKNDKGVIYCGGRGEFGLLAPDSLGFLQYSSLLHLLDQPIDFGDVWATHHIDSSIVFCSYDALFILKNNSITVIEPKTEFERAFTAHGKIFVRDVGHGLYQLTNNKLVLAPGGEFFAHISVAAIFPYKNGGIIIGNPYNFYVSYGNLIKPWNTEVVNFLSGNKIVTCLALNDSTYILANKTQGIVIMDDYGKIQKKLNKSTGLISNSILNVYDDSRGNLWVLTRGGISKVELNGCFNYIHEFHGITGLNYTSCIFKNSLYLGTSEGLYFHKITEEIQGQPLISKFQKTPYIEGNIWSLQQFGEELFCGHSDGVAIITKQKSYQITDAKGAWCFLQPKGFKNIMLAGTYLGIMILEKKDQEWQMRGYVKGFHESSRFLIQDEMEEFWVSHGNKGLYKLSLNHNLDSVLKIKKYGKSEGLSSDFNNTVYYHNGEVIITNNHGFYKYNYVNDHINRWDEFNSALGKFASIQRFVIESNNSFWVILNEEKILHVIKNHSNEFITDITIRKFNKRLAGSFEHIYPINKNTALFATLEGFALFDKKKYFENLDLIQKSFKAFILKVELTRNGLSTINAGRKTNSASDSSHIPKIKHKHNSVRFTFSTNCYEDLELTQFQFFLDGFDTSWSPWTSNSEKEYTNLPPGRYTFSIKAINSFNVISKHDSYEFIILPPWYNSIYAYSIYMVLLLLVLFGGYQFIINRFKLQKKRLNLKKERELWHLNKKYQEEQIKKENEILRLSNEKLSADLANLEQRELLRKKDQQINEEQIQHAQEKYLLEITHKNKELSIMALQIAQKSESISKIREYLISFTEKNNSNDFKTMANHLFQYIEKDGQHDKEWKEFQEYFDMVHSSFLNKLKANYPTISPTLLKLCTYLRVKMSNKQIARLMNTTVESVLKNRYRLREKLQLNTEDNLDDFIENF